ncbi:ectoine dioxygenase-like [Branchiostoma floridae x Branchiostoma japonicum]
MYITMATKMWITTATKRPLGNGFLLLPRGALLPSNMCSLTTKASTYTAVTIRANKRVYHFTTSHGNRHHHVTMATDKDPYHSRLSNVGEIRSRPDPVVWGDDGKPEPFSRQELEFYKTNGYIKVNGLFDAQETQSCLEKFTTVREAFEEDIRLNKKEFLLNVNYSCVTEPGTNKIRTIYNPHKILPVANQLCQDSRLLRRAQQILDSDVYMHHTRLNFKQQFKGTGFYWHSDFETWHVEDGMPRPRSLSCMVLMTRNLPQNGALMAIPGSHRHYISCAGPTPDNHWVTSIHKRYIGLPSHEALLQIMQEGGIHYCTGDEGSVLFFDCNLLHGSHTNFSPWDRMNLFLVYNSLHNKLVAPFGPPKPRPEHLGCRDPAWVLPITPLEKPTEY